MPKATTTVGNRCACKGSANFHYAIRPTLVSLLAVMALISTAKPTFAQCQNPPNDNLVAYYPFSGNANDQSGNGYNGVVQGATLTSDRFGHTDSAYYFDGINDIITFPGLDWNTSASFTTALWFKYCTKDYGTMLTKQDGVHGGFDMNFAKEWAPEKVRVCVGSTDGTWHGVECAFEDTTQWHHLALVYNKSAAMFSEYLDGTSIGSQPIDSVISNEAFVASAGQGIRDDSGLGWFKGSLDEIRIYSRALSATEVLALSLGSCAAIYFDSTTIHNGFIQVMMKNTFDVSAFTLPLLHHSNQAIDSVSKVGCRNENWQSFYGTPYSDTTLLIGGIANIGGSTPCMPPGEGPVARIYFHTSCADTFSVCFDTTYINEPGKLLVTECVTPPVSHIPEFVAGCAQYETSLPGPVADAGSDLELHVCSGSSLNIAAGCTDANGDLVSCELVSGAGTFDGQHISFVPTYGIHDFVLKAIDACGKIDYDTSIVTVINCGDINGDCSRDISDPVDPIGYIFGGGPAPAPLSAGDVNADCAVDISDVVYYINWIFAGVRSRSVDAPRAARWPKRFQATLI